MVLWQVNRILGNDKEIRDYTTAVAKWRLRQQQFPRQQLDATMGTTTDTNTRMEKQEKNVVFCTDRVELLKARQV
jgi:hypothetical protein